MMDIDSVDDLEKNLVPDQKKKNINYFLTFQVHAVPLTQSPCHKSAPAKYYWKWSYS